MSVELSPASQLGFHRPLTQLVKRTLLVTNSNSQPVAFKIKTTAPKQYCVRPNSGRIEPGERVEVQVLLQPMKEEPPAATKCRDKFLVQSAAITPDIETKGLADLWATVEAEHKSGTPGIIHEQKIRCAFLPPVEEYEAGSASAAGSSFAGNASIITNGTPSRYETVRSTHSPTNGDTSIDGFHGADEEPAKPSSIATSTDKVASAIPTSKEEVKSAASTAASNVSAAASSAAATLGLSNSAVSSQAPVSTNRDLPSSDAAALQKQLQEARSEIERLKNIISQKEKEAESGLRQRNTGVKSSDSASQPGAAVATITQEGIPLPVVAAIAGGVFFFTWLFF